MTLTLNPDLLTLFGITFSPDGSQVATVSPLDPRTNFPHGQALSPDGRPIATISADGTIRTYVLSSEELVELARSRVTRSLTTAECQKHLHVRECPERP